MKKKKKHIPAKPLVKIGARMPSNLKFALMVTAAIFWAEFLRTLLTFVFDAYITSLATGPAIRDFVLAVLVTIIVYIVFLSYTKIKRRLQKVKVPAPI